MEKQFQTPEVCRFMVIFFTAILLAGCLGFDQPPAQPDIPSVQCSASPSPGQNLIINETWDNATICASLNSTIMVRLTDGSRTGHTWNMSGSPDLRISDEGITRYQEPGIPPISFTEYGIHAWNVTMNSTGTQSVNGLLRFSGSEKVSTTRTFNVTIVVN